MLDQIAINTYYGPKGCQHSMWTQWCCRHSWWLYMWSQQFLVDQMWSPIQWFQTVMMNPKIVSTGYGPNGCEYSLWIFWSPTLKSEQWDNKVFSLWWALVFSLNVKEVRAVRQQGIFYVMSLGDLQGIWLASQSKHLCRQLLRTVQ